jgi:hypothetical protein
VIEIDRDYTRADEVLTWCRRNLDAKLGGPCLTVLKPAELLSAAAVKCVMDFAKRNKSQVCLVSSQRIPVVQVVYLKSAPWNFQTSLARRLGCPNQHCDHVVRQCGGDLRQLQLVASSASLGEQAFAMVDPRYHAHFNLGDLLSGQTAKVPEDSIVPFAVQSNVLQPGTRQIFDDLDAMANFAADAVHLDALGFTDETLGLGGQVVKLSLQTNHLLGRRVKIDSRVLPNIATTREATRAAMLPTANIMLDGIRVESAVMERIRVAVCYTDAEWTWFARLAVAHVHELIRKECMNFHQGYRRAMDGLRALPFDSESQREWCEMTGGMLEHLFETYGPLCLLGMDLYAYYQIQDPIRNMEIIYRVAGTDSSWCLAFAFPPYDFSLLYEEDREYQLVQLANFQETPSAFDFESVLPGSGAVGSADGPVLGSPEVTS